MKKIECILPDEINKVVDKIIEQKHQTRAEFNRRAIEFYVDAELTAQNNLEGKISKFLGKE